GLAARTSAHGAAMGGLRNVAPLKGNGCVPAFGRVDSVASRTATSGSRIRRPRAGTCDPARLPGRRLRRWAAPGQTRDTGFPNEEDRDEPPPTRGGTGLPYRSRFAARPDTN